MCRFASLGGAIKPSRNDGLNACFQFDHTDWGVFVQVGSLNVKYVWPPSKAVGLILVVECVKNFHYRMIMFSPKMTSLISQQKTYTS